MSGRRIWLFVCLLAAAVPMLAADNLILVRVDTKANRAYIPEGTVLPQGLAIRAKKEPIGPVTLDRGGMRAPREIAPKRLEPKNTLIFEYAPAETFAAMRERYVAKQAREKNPRLTPHNQSCGTVYVDDEAEGYYGTQYGSFSSTICMPAQGPFVTGTYYPVDYTAQAESWADEGWVAVWDANNRFTCQDNYAVYGLSCTAGSNVRFWSYSNTITTAGSFSVIEYLQNYEPWYTGFSFEVVWHSAHE
jgi:hypothetical protein